jgi:hypothetical protein
MYEKAGFKRVAEFAGWARGTLQCRSLQNINRTVRNVVERRLWSFSAVFQVNLSHGVMSQDASCWLTLFAGIALTGLVTFLCDFLAEPTVATQVCAVVMTIERPV